MNKFMANTIAAFVPGRNLRHRVRDSFLFGQGSGIAGRLEELRQEMHQRLDFIQNELSNSIPGYMNALVDISKVPRLPFRRQDLPRHAYPAPSAEERRASLHIDKAGFGLLTPELVKFQRPAR
jgi:hypothetical protein